MQLLCGVWALWGGLEWDRTPWPSPASLKGLAKPPGSPQAITLDSLPPLGMGDSALALAITLIFKSLCVSSITVISMRWTWETFLKTTLWKKPLCHKLTKDQLICVDPGDPTPADSYLDKPRGSSRDLCFLLPSRLGNDFSRCAGDVESTLLSGQSQL